MEWTVEKMHWLVDVYLGEDYCRVEDWNIQQNLNMIDFRDPNFRGSKININIKFYNYDTIVLHK